MHLPWAPMNFYGSVGVHPRASHGLPWSYTGHPWNCRGLPWNSVDLEGASVGFHELPWVSRELQRFSHSWASMSLPCVSHGSLMSSTCVRHGSCTRRTRVSMDSHGLLSLSWAQGVVDFHGSPVSLPWVSHGPHPHGSHVGLP